jgi:hypothetical protein
MRLRASRCVPCGSPRRPLPVKARGEDGTSVALRRASAWSGWWTPAPRYRCHHPRTERIEEMSPAALVQSTVFNEHPRVAATSDLLAQSLLPSTRPLLAPLRFAGRCFIAVGRRRHAVVSACRTRMTAQLGHAADRGLETSHPGTVLVSGNGNPRVDLVGSHERCCASRIFCGPVPRVLATDAPAHHPPPSFWEDCGWSGLLHS